MHRCKADSLDILKDNLERLQDEGLELGDEEGARLQKEIMKNNLALLLSANDGAERLPWGDCLTMDALMACITFGPYQVRRAALEEMQGNPALFNVGLPSHLELINLQRISMLAFSYMLPKERHHEFCLKANMNFFWPIGTAK